MFAPVRGRRDTELYLDAYEAVLEEGITDLVMSATVLHEQINTFVKAINVRTPPDLLQTTLAEIKTPLFGQHRGLGFLNKVSANYSFSDFSAIGTLDIDSAVYKFQLDNETAALAAYFHPPIAREIVFFWIGQENHANTSEFGLKMLRDPQMNWSVLSRQYEVHLDRARDAD